MKFQTFLAISYSTIFPFLAHYAVKCCQLLTSISFFLLLTVKEIIGLLHEKEGVEIILEIVNDAFACSAVTDKDKTSGLCLGKHLKSHKMNYLTQCSGIRIKSVIILTSLATTFASKVDQGSKFFFFALFLKKVCLHY